MSEIQENEQPVEPPKQSGVETQSAINKTTFKLNSLSHVRQYPLISDLIGYLMSFTVLATLIQHVGGWLTIVLEELSQSSALVDVINTIDGYIMKVLLYLDKVFPSITTISVSDLQQSVNLSAYRIIEFFKAYRGAVYSKTQHYINPIVKKVNDFYEASLNGVIPSSRQKGQNISAESASENDQLSRSYSLLKETYARLRPYIQNVTAIPGHVGDVYKLQRVDAKTVPEAISKASGVISSEVYETIHRIRFKPGDITPTESHMGAVATN